MFVRSQGQNTNNPQKAKLKVGKTKAKPTNYTDTSFVAKSISLPTQSLSRNEDADVDLIKRLSLLKHHASQTRKETLIFIEQHLPENPALYKQIITAIVPLIIDQSLSVRTALVSLLTEIGKRHPNLIELHTRSIILFVHSAMTHITPAIRSDSVRFLNLLIAYGPNALIKSSWVKTLKSFFILLNWTLNSSKQSVSLAITSSVTSNISTKAKQQALDSLVRFLKIGVFQEPSTESTTQLRTVHPLTKHYLLPAAPQPFASLKLFTRELTTTNRNSSDETIDLNKVSCEDYETRIQVFCEHFSQPAQKNLVNLIKEGGELGKSANTLQNLLERVDLCYKESLKID